MPTPEINEVMIMLLELDHPDWECDPRRWKYEDIEDFWSELEPLYEYLRPVQVWTSVASQWNKGTLGQRYSGLVRNHPMRLLPDNLQLLEDWRTSERGENHYHNMVIMDACREQSLLNLEVARLWAPETDWQLAVGQVHNSVVYVNPRIDIYRLFELHLLASYHQPPAKCASAASGYPILEYSYPGFVRGEWSEEDMRNSVNLCFHIALNTMREAGFPGQATIIENLVYKRAEYADCQYHMHWPEWLLDFGKAQESEKAA